MVRISLVWYCLYFFKCNVTLFVCSFACWFLSHSASHRLCLHSLIYTHAVDLTLLIHLCVRICTERSFVQCGGNCQSEHRYTSGHWWHTAGKTATLCRVYGMMCTLCTLLLLFTVYYALYWALTLLWRSWCRNSLYCMLVSVRRQLRLYYCQLTLNTHFYYMYMHTNRHRHIHSSCMHTHDNILCAYVCAFAIPNYDYTSDLASQIHLVLSPPASGGMLYDVDLYCTDRLQRQRNANTFDTMERTSQSIGIRTG